MDDQQRLTGVIQSLEKEATLRVQARSTLEHRLLRDLRMYHGRYDNDTETRMSKGEGSTLFVNLAGPKTDAMAARLMDLLFPVDERNWDIEPTPVPQLDEAATEAVKMRTQAEIEGQQDQANAAASVEAEIEAVRDEASKRCRKMIDVMDDQLKASQYSALCRDVIDDAAKYGTGICKGPVSGAATKRSWAQDEAGGYALQTQSDNLPGYKHVDIWSFFPPLNEPKLENCDGIFERHLMNKKALRRLAHRSDFSSDAIRKLLEDDPRSTVPTHYAEVQSLGGKPDAKPNDMFTVWEYSGALEADDMRLVAEAMDPEFAADMADGEIDPLTETNVVVWFCQDQLLKFAIHPMDSGDPIYSVFNLKKDEGSLFGYGIPHIMNDAQSMLNAGMRMMMDNSGFAAGPHVVVDDKQVTPENGDWSLRGPKIWRAKDGIPKDAPPFAVFKFDSNQGELANIMAIAKQHIDDETGLNKLNQGDGQDTPQSKTLGGTALLMNAANVIFRRMVKNFDDDMTAPNIRRLYDWNMQHGSDESIKGDFGIVARGSSTLLLREVQAQNLAMFNMQYAAHPIYGPMLKHRDMLRETIKANSLPEKSIMLSDADIDQIQAQQAEAAQGGGGDPLREAELQLKQAELELRQNEMDAKVAIAEMERDTKLQIAGLTADLKMTEVAENANIRSDEKMADLADKREERQAENERLALEAEMTLATGMTAGGRV